MSHHRTPRSLKHASRQPNGCWHFLDRIFSKPDHYRRMVFLILLITMTATHSGDVLAVLRTMH